MAKKEKKTSDKEALLETIKPENIKVMDDDSDMPAPQTKVYKKYLRVTDLFMRLFGQCVNTLPYKTTLQNSNGQQIGLSKLVAFVEQNRNKISEEDMNHILSYIDNLDFQHARPLMDVVLNKEQQQNLWSMFEE